MTPDLPVRRRILLAEDQGDLRHMLKLSLELAGHEVFEAHDGPSAVRVAQDRQPDTALIDIGLPGCDGYEVARQVRQCCGRAIRLVALTGHDTSEDRSRATDAGFDTYLVKPVNPARLHAMLA